MALWGHAHESMFESMFDTMFTCWMSLVSGPAGARLRLFFPLAVGRYSGVWFLFADMLAHSIYAWH